MPTQDEQITKLIAAVAALLGVPDFTRRLAELEEPHKHPHEHGLQAHEHEHRHADFDEALARLEQVDQQNAQSTGQAKAAHTLLEQSVANRLGEIQDTIVVNAQHEHDTAPPHSHPEFAQIALIWKAIEEHKHPDLSHRLDVLQEHIAAAVAQIAASETRQAKRGDDLTAATKTLREQVDSHEHPKAPAHTHDGLALHNHDYAKPEQLKDGTLVYRCQSPGCATVFTVGG